VAQVDRIDKNVTGIALSAALGFGLGIVGGMLLRGFVGGANAEPMQNAVRRLKQPHGETKQELGAIEDAVIEAWEDDTDLRSMPLTVEALGDGIIEITGTASTSMTRQLAGDVARSVPGADVVLNRIHIEGASTVASKADLAPEPG